MQNDCCKIDHRSYSASAYCYYKYTRANPQENKSVFMPAASPKILRK